MVARLEQKVSIASRQFGEDVALDHLRSLKPPRRLVRWVDVLPIAVFWWFSLLLERPSIPTIPARPAPNYPVKSRVPPPPPPPHPTWEEFVAKVNGKGPQQPQ